MNEDRIEPGMTMPTIPPRQIKGLPLPQPVELAFSALRAALPQAAWNGPYRGAMPMDGRCVEVHLEPGDWVRCMIPIEDAPTPASALRRQTSFHGNVRFVLLGQDTYLAADTLVDSQVQLRRTLHAMLGSLARASGARDAEWLVSHEDEVVESEVVARALAELPRGLERLERGDSSWEARPYVGGTATPVQVSLSGPIVRVQHDFSRRRSSGVALQAAAHWLLQLQRRLRLARFALRPSGFAAEVELHAWQISGRWLLRAVEAVAVAACCASEMISLMSETPSLAEWYTACWPAKDADAERRPKPQSVFGIDSLCP